MEVGWDCYDAATETEHQHTETKDQDGDEGNGGNGSRRDGTRNQVAPGKPRGAKVRVKQPATTPGKSTTAPREGILQIMKGHLEE